MTVRSKRCLPFGRSPAVAAAAVALLSCATPHPGPASSESVPSDSSHTAAAGTSDDGLALLRKLQDAVGGADRIAAVRDFEETVRGETWDQDGRRIGEVRKRVLWVRPNHLRLDQVGPGDTFVLYYDGTAGWEILPDGRTLDLAGGEARFARKYLRGFFLAQLLADRDPSYVVDSPAPNVVRIGDREDETHGEEFWLDPTSWLPVKTTSISLADPAHPVPKENRYKEWETVEGIRFARRFSVFHGGLHLAEATVERILVNSGLDPRDLGRKPSDGKPVLAQ